MFAPAYSSYQPVLTVDHNQPLLVPVLLNLNSLASLQLQNLYEETDEQGNLFIKVDDLKFGKPQKKEVSVKSGTAVTLQFPGHTSEFNVDASNPTWYQSDWTPCAWMQRMPWQAVPSNKDKNDPNLLMDTYLVNGGFDVQPGSSKCQVRFTIRDAKRENVNIYDYVFNLVA